MYAREWAVPERPKLREYLTRKRVADDHLLFEAGADVVSLRGKSVIDLLPSLLECLDGNWSVTHIKDKLSFVEPQVIDEALQLLARNNLLENSLHRPPDTLPRSVLERAECQMNFWLSVRNDRYELQDALWKANVSIVGLGGVGAAVAEFLASAGVGSLLLIDGDLTRVSDQLYGVRDAHDKYGESRTQWLKDRLSSTPTRIETSAELPSGPESWEALIGNSNLVLICEDYPNPATARVINEACLRVGTPFICAHVDHNRAVVGPFVVPGQTGCFTCYEYRCLGNSPYGNCRTESGSGAGGRAFGMLGPFAGFVGSYVALEALKSLTNFAYPATTGRIHTMDFFTMESEFHDVLKLPRCPSCGPGRQRPQMKIWELDTPKKAMELRAGDRTV